MSIPFKHALYPAEDTVMVYNKIFLKSSNPDSFNWKFVYSGITRASSTLDSRFYPSKEQWKKLGYLKEEE